MPETSYRIDDLDRRVSVLERKTENVNVTQSEVANLRLELRELSKEVSALRKSIITAALTFAIGSVGIAITISQAF